MTSTLRNRRFLARVARDVSRLGVALGSALALLGCAWGVAAPLPTSLPEQATPPGSVRVRLVFGTEADLDLFVTSPDQETVYFGNTPSLAGGVLAKDLRCVAEGPRIEVVTFENARPGRYRIGVDYARSCRLRRRTVPYRVEAVAGESDWRAEGEIAPAVFENLALEFELSPPSE